jgi:hypothetical protein
MWLQRRCELIFVVLASSRGLSRRRRAQPPASTLASGVSYAVVLPLRHFGVSNAAVLPLWFASFFVSVYRIYRSILHMAGCRITTVLVFWTGRAVYWVKITF